jgi:hypothetical protein
MKRREDAYNLVMVIVWAVIVVVAIRAAIHLVDVFVLR